MMSFFGQLTALVFITDHRRLLGIRHSSLLRAVLLILAFATWWQQYTWSDVAAILLLLLFATLGALYWYERRKGYTFFRVDRQAKLADDQREMPIETRFDVRATGVFATEERQDYAFLRPSKVWRMSSGDIGLMVSRTSKTYLYEFILPEAIRRVEPGSLLFGSDPLPTLSIQFDSSWGPEFSQYEFTYVAGTPRSVAPNHKVIFLTFEDEESLRLVWSSMARRTKAAN